MTSRFASLPIADAREAWASGRWPGLVASSLLLASAALQFGASAQRWRFAGPSVASGDRSIEDHLFDYVVPADPWVGVGDAAALFGIGSLLIAAAISCLAAGAAAAHRTPVATWWAGGLAAAPAALTGLHALISDLLGSPSVLQHVVGGFAGVILGIVQVAALLLLAWLAARRSLGWALGAVILIGSTVFGHMVAVFVVAPAIAGYQSYDTTPWSEAVVAAITALASVVVLSGARPLASDAATPTTRALSPQRRGSLGDGGEEGGER